MLFPLPLVGRGGGWGWGAHEFSIPERVESERLPNPPPSIPPHKGEGKSAHSEFISTARGGRASASGGWRRRSMAARRGSTPCGWRGSRVRDDDTETISPTLWVKPWPLASRSSTGANMVPRNSTAPSGYWWLAPIICADQIGRIAADLRHRARCLERNPSGPLDRQRQFDVAHVVEREAIVEQADERPERGAGIVVLGLAEQQRRAALDIAQVDVIAEGRADDLARRRRPRARPPAPDCSRWNRVDADIVPGGRPPPSAAPW